MSAPQRALALATGSFWTTAFTVVVLTALATALTVRVFGLRVTGALSLYFIIWWTLLFAALPFGVRSQAESGEITSGTEPGAPSLPRLREKAVWTSLASGLVLLIAAWLLPLAGL